MRPIYSLLSKFRRLLKEISTPFIRALMNKGTQNGYLAALYYLLLNRSFMREQMVFLAGRAEYERSLDAPKGTMAKLRRNIHRLEKGLLMRPRRVPFARDYIGETVDAFNIANSRGDDMDPLEMEWAQDVLAEYFRVHADCEEVTVVRSLFEVGYAERLKCSIPSKIPYKRNLVSALPITIKEMDELAKRRRSVRWFLQKPVERELIDEALKIGAQAPSACNRQPFEFRIFDDPELVQKVISIPFGLVGYGHNVPVVVVVVGQQRHFFSERDRHLVYIDSSLAVMGFLFALETQGLSSCCVNWPDIEVNEKKIADILKLQYDERPIMLIALGYPDPEGLVANSSKKSLSHLRRYNFERANPSP